MIQISTRNSLVCDKRKVEQHEIWDSRIIAFPRTGGPSHLDSRPAQILNLIQQLGNLSECSVLARAHRKPSFPSCVREEWTS